MLPFDRCDLWRFPWPSCWPLCICAQYGTQNLTEDTAVGHTIVTISATDADDPDSGSSKIEFHISSGNDDEVFRVETDGQGVGHVVIAKVKL